MEKDRHADNLALAGLVRLLGGMLLTAGVACLLLGAFAFDRDRRVREAMGQALATVTAAYVHGGAYYVAYEADGTVHEALMAYEGKPLAPGDQVPIRYDLAAYEGVRPDTPATQPLLVLSGGVLCAVLGGLAMFGQVYLKGRDANPWHDQAA